MSRRVCNSTPKKSFTILSGIGGFSPALIYHVMQALCGTKVSDSGEASSDGQPDLYALFHQIRIKPPSDP